MTATKTISLATTTDVVAYIASTVAKVIATEGFPGHDIDTVGTRMTSDTVLSTIRDAYVHMARRGDDRPTAISKIGVRLIAEYYNEFQLG